MTPEQITRGLAAKPLSKSGNHGEGDLCAYCDAPQTEQHKASCLYACAVAWVDSQKPLTVTTLQGDPLTAKMVADMEPGTLRPFVAMLPTGGVTFYVENARGRVLIHGADGFADRVRPVFLGIMEELATKKHGMTAPYTPVLSVPSADQ